MTRQQLESAVHEPLHCKRPDHPTKPLDATDVDCVKPSDLARGDIVAGIAYNHPISFVYRFQRGRLGVIYVLGLRPGDYTLVLSGLVAKFSTPEKVGKGRRGRDWQTNRQRTGCVGGW